MSSPSAIPCREVFDENSQPSAEEISEYAQQLGIDPESESHLLPLARDGLMQALPMPWKAYYDEKLQTHYYYNEETKKTQWDHPLDDVYREIVKKARDASTHDDTCASVQELLTSEENTKLLERVETKVESDDEDFTIDSENHASEVKEAQPKRPVPLGRPPLAPLSKLDKKLSELKISPLRRTADGTFKPMLMRNTSDRDIFSRQYERPKTLFKQQSEIIDLKMHVLTSPEEENFRPLLGGTKVDKGLPLTGKGSMFLKSSKDLNSPDTEKSLPLDSLTKSDPPKGILREKVTDTFQRKTESVVIGKQRQAASLDEDRKSVRFKLENLPDPSLSPSSNSSSEQNDNHSIISAPIAPSPVVSSPVRGSSPALSSVRVSSPSSTTNVIRPLVLSPLAVRPPLPNVDSPKLSDKESLESDRVSSPRRRVLRPPAGDYIKPDLFQKSFQKIADIVRPGDIETNMVNLEEHVDKDIRPRSPMIPQQKNKISINLMESIESETSTDSPDKEFANLDLNDLDDSNVLNESKTTNSEREHEKDSPKTDDNSERTSVSKTSNSTQNKTPRLIDNIPIPEIKVPKLNLSPKVIVSDADDSKKVEDAKKVSKSDSIDIKSPQAKVSPLTSDGSDAKSPRYDFNKPWSSLSTFKPMNKAIIAPLKASESSSSLGKGLTSPRLDGVILSQGKSSSDNVVVVYQFETQEDSIAKPRSPIPDVGREMIERSKVDERKRLELALQKELEGIKVEIATKERRMRAELQYELKEIEEKFIAEKRVRLTEQAERHRKEMEEAISSAERSHQEAMLTLTKEMEERHRRDTEAAEKQHNDNMARLREEYQRKLAESRERLEIENERALSELREQLQANFNRQRARLLEQNKAAIEKINEQHRERVAELTQDYRAEVERVRSQHACHLQEVRAKLARPERALADKYRALKEKHARLKHDVKMSIERRNKRREMSMTTGSETEKSNSHKANQSLEKCREANETSSVSAPAEPGRRRTNNNDETSVSDSHALRSDNNNQTWGTHKKLNPPSNTSQPSKRPHRKTAVAFREPPTRERDRDAGATTDCQDSSDATTADDRPKDSVNGHGRRRCFTRLKSASTSRLNYSPKRGEGWSSPLESLRQQLRKLDDLEDQFPDLACQPAYSLRYPFAELGPVTRADTPELEFVRHRALVEREGMRRARAVLKRRRAALRESRASLSPHRAPSEERETTELEVALHRARALLGEKEIRLRHIERALRKLAEHPPPLIQEATTSEASSESEAQEEAEATGAVLRSLRALHADVRDIWRALDVRARTASPESSSNAVTTSQTRMTLSAPEPAVQDLSDGSVAEKARGLRVWLQTAP